MGKKKGTNKPKVRSCTKIPQDMRKGAVWYDTEERGWQVFQYQSPTKVWMTTGYTAKSIRFTEEQVRKGLMTLPTPTSRSTAAINYVPPKKEEPVDIIREQEEDFQNSAWPTGEEVLPEPTKFSKADVGAYIGDTTSNVGGKSKSAYSSWNNMVHRCYNPNMHNYAPERSICDDWLCFANYEEWYDNHYVPNKRLPIHNNVYGPEPTPIDLKEESMTTNTESANLVAALTPSEVWPTLANDVETFAGSDKELVGKAIIGTCCKDAEPIWISTIIHSTKATELLHAEFQKEDTFKYSLEKVVPLATYVQDVVEYFRKPAICPQEHEELQTKAVNQEIELDACNKAVERLKASNTELSNDLTKVKEELQKEVSAHAEAITKITSQDLMIKELTKERNTLKKSAEVCGKEKSDLAKKLKQAEELVYSLSETLDKLKDMYK